MPARIWGGGPTTFAGSSDVLVEMNTGCDWVWLSCRTGESLDRYLALADEARVTWECVVRN
jgi:hypothetical protein